MYARPCARGGRPSRTAGNFPSKHQCKAERSLLICLYLSVFTLDFICDLLESWQPQKVRFLLILKATYYCFLIKKLRAFTALPTKINSWKLWQNVINIIFLSTFSVFSIVIYIEWSHVIWNIFIISMQWKTAIIFLLEVI